MRIDGIVTKTEHIHEIKRSRYLVSADTLLDIVALFWNRITLVFVYVLGISNLSPHTSLIPVNKFDDGPLNKFNEIRLKFD